MQGQNFINRYPVLNDSVLKDSELNSEQEHSEREALPLLEGAGERQ